VAPSEIRDSTAQEPAILTNSTPRPENQIKNLGAEKTKRKTERASLAAGFIDTTWHRCFDNDPRVWHMFSATTHQTAKIYTKKRRTYHIVYRAAPAQNIYLPPTPVSFAHVSVQPSGAFHGRIGKAANRSARRPMKMLLKTITNRQTPSIMFLCIMHSVAKQQRISHPSNRDEQRAKPPRQQEQQNWGRGLWHSSVALLRAHDMDSRFEQGSLPELHRNDNERDVREYQEQPSLLTVPF
jgi:hypothetical protein